MSKEHLDQDPAWVGKPIVVEKFDKKIDGTTEQILNEASFPRLGQDYTSWIGAGVYRTVDNKQGERVNGKKTPKKIIFPAGK